MNPAFLNGIGRAFRTLPAGLPGKARLARRIMGRALETSDVSVTLADGSSLIVPSIAEPIGFHLYIDGVYELAESAWLREQLRAGDVYVDVGANVGGFVVPLSRHVGPRGRVIAIEASPTVASYLRRNVAGNELTNVTVVEMAASDRSSGSAAFYDAPANRFGSGGLGDVQGYQPTAVPLSTLDDILERAAVSQVKVLKVDVEGFEAGVFRGAKRLLSGARAPIVVFEFFDWAERRAGNPGDAQLVLKDAGYSIWRFEDFRPGVPPLNDCLTGEPGGNLIAARGVPWL